MPRPKREPPRTFSENWPEARCADAAADVIREIAVRVLELAAREGSVRALAQEARVDHSVVHDLVSGNSWPEAATIARLEIGLDDWIWPTRP